MALRMSFASLLPAFHASLPAVLPAVGATFTPAFAPTLAPLAFLLAIAYLHPFGASSLETPRYPEWCLRKQPGAHPTSSLFDAAPTPGTARAISPKLTYLVLIAGRT